MATTPQKNYAESNPIKIYKGERRFRNGFLRVTIEGSKYDVIFYQPGEGFTHILQFNIQNIDFFEKPATWLETANKHSADAVEVAWQLFGNNRVTRTPQPLGLVKLIYAGIYIHSKEFITDNPNVLFEAFSLAMITITKQRKRPYFAPTYFVYFSGLDDRNAKFLLEMFRRDKFAVFYCEEPVTSDNEKYLAVFSDEAMFSKDYVRKQILTELHPKIISKKAKQEPIDADWQPIPND